MATPPTDLERLIESLAQPGVLPGSEGGPVEIAQTHISVVFLTRDRAFKLKKPVDFGFLDFSTPELRAHFCREELRLNRRLAPDAYLGLCPVHRLADGRIEVGEPAASPPPADELLVAMVRLPADRMLDRMLAEGTVVPRHIERIARVMASFHDRVDAGPEVSRFGTREAVGRLALENFDQTVPFVGDLFDEPRHGAMRRRTGMFLETRERLFARRVEEARIRDGHGDLHSPNICIVGDDPVIYDCIEFSPAYRAVDVASEIGFLAMDLEYRGRPDLARLLVDAYVRESEDEPMRAMLPFYIAYRAMVRAKISALTAAAPEIDDAVRERARRAGASFFDLAHRWSEGLVPPALVMVAGPLGAGRRRLAAVLAERAGLRPIDGADLRASIVGVSREEVDRAADDALFSESVTRATCRALARNARRRLEHGETALVVDFLFREEHRSLVAEAARATGVPVVLVTIEASDERLATALRAAGIERPAAAYEAQRRAADRPGAFAGPGVHVPLEAGPDVEAQAAEVLRRCRELAGSP
ncbi:MAG: bifunctional aminoglycoside phosphotransferase/ATP-binding protein [Acidobacteriota bacterium]